MKYGEPTRRTFFSNKRNEVLTHATTWMSLEKIMLSEEARNKGHMIPFV